MIRWREVVAVLAASLALGLVGAALPTWAQGEDFPVPKGRLVVGDENGLYVMNADGSEKTYLVEENDPNCWLRDGVWSPDGTQIMYTTICGGASPADWRPEPGQNGARERTASVSVYDLRSGETRELVPSDGVHQDYAGDWHPDGDKVVIYSDRDPSETFNFYLYDLTTGELTQLTTFDTNASRVSFDPSGRYLLYNRSIVEPGDIHFEVRAYDLTNGQDISVARGFTPNWSPDGQWIAYATEGDETDIYVMPADCIYNGGGCDAERDARNITLSPRIAEREPVFSPDQTQLVYVRDTDEAPGTLTWDIFRHDIRTAKRVNLTDSPELSERHRDWEPEETERVNVADVLPVVVRVSTGANAANLRAEPTTNAELAGVLPNGTLLIVQASNATRDWYRVTLPEDGAEGWIYGALVAPTQGTLQDVPQAP